MTLHHLARFPDVAALLADTRQHDPVFYETHMARADDGVIALWAGDAAYDSGDADTPGARHRLWIGAGPWRLERSS